MPARWQKELERWVRAGLLDAATTERIHAYEAEQAQARGLRWPVLLAVSFGGVLLAAGVLLFVAAHWDELSPAARFSLVMVMVALFHAAGAALADRFSVLSTVLHAVGTVCLGAGIFLAGQIFNLEEHWPGGLMLWALGAWIGWALLRDWPQATLAAILTPAWLVGEWTVATERYHGGELVMTEGLLLLAITYLSARTPERENYLRRALAWVGGIALIPCALLVVASYEFSYLRKDPTPQALMVLGWTIALAVPLVVAYLLRGRAAWLNILAAAWVLILGTAVLREGEAQRSLLLYAWQQLGPYAWCIAGSLGLTVWGQLEARKERINLGVAGFALTVLIFYFSSAMDKLGRATGLIGLGVLFLAGGWMLERTRRRLIAGLPGGAK